MKITKEEISLCKQVAERHRKEVEYGDWFLSYDNEIRLKTFFGKGYREEEDIPLWTIPDCLEFLREKGYRVKLYDAQGVVDPFTVNCYGHKSKKAFHRYGETDLEAFLKAVLAVLEEKK